MVAPMADNQFLRTRDIFSKISQLAQSDQQDALAAACGADDNLRREVAALLAAHTAANEFLNDSPLAVPLRDLADQTPEPEALVGTRVGVYVLTSLIGVGGMGGVYLAERDDDEFTKTVAVKILHDELATAELVSRFHRERQVLADLEHPNIARLYDGGITDDGRLYIVMEYIDGEAIDAHCERHHLSRRQKLALFQEVCRAVQYAHRNLIVHRDLKPSNILIDQTGSVKLLDFGIAEALPEATNITGTSDDEPSPQSPSFSYRYASPEQRTGAAATLTTDVFSLGIVLRHLLTGSPNGQLDHLPPELEAIVTMASDNDSEHRYHSVEHLSDELDRYRSHQPLHAMAPTATYRLQKFIGRHRAGVIWSAGLAGLLLGATILSVKLAVRADQQEAIAQERFEEVRELATTYLFEINDELANYGATAAREKMVTTGLKYLNTLNAQPHDDPDLARDIAHGYFKIAALQGDPSISGVGDPDAGLINCRHGLAILQALADRGLHDDQLTLLQAEGQQVMGNISRHFHDLTTSRQYYEAALAQRQTVVSDSLGIPRIYAIHRSYARTLERAGMFTEAIDHYEAAQENLTALAAQYPALTDLAEALLATRVDLGQVYRYMGKPAQARRMLEAQIPALEAGIAAQIEGKFLPAMLAGARMNLGRALDQLGESPAAADELEAALIIWQDLNRADPRNVTLQLNTSSTHNFLGQLQGKAGDQEGALDHFQQMLAIRQRVAAGKPDSYAYQHEVATALDMTGGALRRLGRLDEALDRHNQANDLFRQVADARPDDAEARRDVAISYYMLGQLHASIAGENHADTTVKSVASRDSALTKAVFCYRQSRDVMAAMAAAGVLAERDDGVIEMLDAEIAKIRRTRP